MDLKMYKPLKNPIMQSRAITKRIPWLKQLRKCAGKWTLEHTEEKTPKITVWELHSLPDYCGCQALKSDVKLNFQNNKMFAKKPKQQQKTA